MKIKVTFEQLVQIFQNKDFVVDKSPQIKDFDLVLSKKISDEWYNVGLIIGEDDIQKAKSLKLDYSEEIQKILLVNFNLSNNSEKFRLLKEQASSFGASIEILTSQVLRGLLNDNYVEVFDNLEESVKQDLSVVARLTYEICDRLAYEIAKNPKTLHLIEWRDIERTMARVLDQIGFNVTLTPSSKDGGKDIVVECVIDGSTNIYYIEVKHWKTRVGKNYIKDFINVVVKDRVTKGLYLSTMGFTGNYLEALNEVESKLLKVGDRSNMVSFCKKFVKQKEGIFIPNGQLDSILFENTI